ncbi:MAG TPA: hypothetical protein VMX97_08995, partial [Hyphomicrobiaceae bacterium]|nr:hypothetical protein [Hyphomicrobiaceae bacterium]
PVPRGTPIEQTQGSDELLVQQTNINGGPGMAAALDEGLYVRRLEGTRAEAEAFSGKVAVKNTGATQAEDDGIDAISEAEAYAGIENIVGQENLNAASASATARLGFNYVEQDQTVTQFNRNQDLGMASAEAEAEAVTVEQWGDVDAKDDGIKAKSLASAGAGTTQEANQSNSNAADASSAYRVSQSQDGERDFDPEFSEVLSVRPPERPIGVEQRNDNVQVSGDGGGMMRILTAETPDHGGERPRSFGAFAQSDDVTVIYEGHLKAGGDGIVAKSAAEAENLIGQKAGQANSNTAEATLLASRPMNGIPGAGEVDDLTSLIFIEPILGQNQFVFQGNRNRQLGAASALAIAGEVSVKQAGMMTVGDDGIVAVSEGKALAGVLQEAVQSNDNSAVATVEAPVLNGDGGDSDFIAQEILPFDVYAQEQRLRQRNVNTQMAGADAVAFAEEVTVKAWNDPAGGNGIIAKSVAKAEAAVVQSAEQTNTNSAEMTIEAPQFVISEDGETPPEPTFKALDSKIPPAVVAFQDQGLLKPEKDKDGEAGTLNSDERRPAIGQSNESRQSAGGDLVTQFEEPGEGPGGAFALAVADDVFVAQAGVLEAGKSGIIAESLAKAAAPVAQSVAQSNKNSAVLTYEGAQIDIDLQVEAPVATATSVRDDIQVGEQTQTVAQDNLSDQSAAAEANAQADDVTAKQWGTMTVGGDGIVARSAAQAEAGVMQDASQSNENSADATFGGSQIDILAQSGTEPDEPVSANPRTLIEDGVVEAESETNGGRAYGNASQEGGALAQTTDIFESRDVAVAVSQVDGLDLALQGQRVEQGNENTQFGFVVARADSNDVTVESQN